MLTSTAGDEVEDPPGEAPAASAAQAAQGRARKREAGWAGVQVGWAGWLAGQLMWSLAMWNRPQAGNKMEAMEAVERDEGFFGGWSLHAAIWLGRR